MNTLERAITIAAEAHSGQVDKAGAPYILHPLRLMLHMTTTDERIVAVLHDVVEDSDWSSERLRAEGFSDTIIEGVESVTRRPDETYQEFVSRAAINPLGRRVKLADLHDNCDLSRIADPTEEDRRRVAKYKRAIVLLETPTIEHPGPPGLEIERKFLVDGENVPADLTSYPHDDIRQGYVAADGNSVVRLRQKGETCYITVKSGHGLARNENEGVIPRKTFEALWPTTGNRNLEKVRYAIPGPDGLTFELDLYGDPLQGLTTVEVEFESIEAAQSFVPPGWFGRDVTENPRFSNYRLATDGLPESDPESGAGSGAG